MVDNVLFDKSMPPFFIFMIRERSSDFGPMKTTVVPKVTRGSHASVTLWLFPHEYNPLQQPSCGRQPRGEQLDAALAVSRFSVSYYVCLRLLEMQHGKQSQYVQHADADVVHESYDLSTLVTSMYNPFFPQFGIHHGFRAVSVSILIPQKAVYCMNK